MSNDRSSPASKGARATSRDVAKALNISQSTVSRAFTPGASISPALRARILAAADKVGYQPNLLARGLIAGSSNLIGVVLARQTNLLYPELLYQLSGRLAERGYQVLLFPIGEEATIEEAIGRIRSYRVDAVLATGVLDDTAVLEFIRHDLPLVTFNRVFDLPISSVSCDFAAGARDLAGRLLRSGCDSLGLIAGPENSYVSAEVERGVRAALQQSGVALTVARTSYSYESGAPALDALIAEAGRLPSALLCVNDTVAAGCLDHLRGALKRSVPRDVSIVTFEGHGPSQWQGYHLTGVQQPMEAMTGAAVELLLERVADSSRPAERRSFIPAFVAGGTAHI